MHIAIDTLVKHIQFLDSKISVVKYKFLSACPVVLQQDIIQFIQSLHSRLYSHLMASKASQLNSLLGPSPVSPNNHTSFSGCTNLVGTIPPDLPLTDSESSVLVKGLKFVPNPGSLDFYTAKADTESFFRRLCLKAHFHNQTSASQRDVFEATNPKKSSWSPPEGQFGSLDLFIRQCRHEIDQLPKF